MKNKTGKLNEVVIDEDKHTSSPTFFQRIKHVIMAVLMGIVFGQVMLFAFRIGSVVIYFLLYTELALAYLLVCAVLGWFISSFKHLEKKVRTGGIYGESGNGMYNKRGNGGRRRHFGLNYIWHQCLYDNVHI